MGLQLSEPSPKCYSTRRMWWCSSWGFSFFSMPASWCSEALLAPGAVFHQKPCMFFLCAVHVEDFTMRKGLVCSCCLPLQEQGSRICQTRPWMNELLALAVSQQTFQPVEGLPGHTHLHAVHSAAVINRGLEKSRSARCASERLHSYLGNSKGQLHSACAWQRALKPSCHWHSDPELVCWTTWASATQSSTNSCWEEQNRWGKEVGWDDLLFWN